MSLVMVSVAAFLNTFYFLCFFFNDTATTEIYTLSLHDALPILAATRLAGLPRTLRCSRRPGSREDRNSTRLNSSHITISYAVFCLKKKNITEATKHKLQNISITHPDEALIVIK